jgi:hypothetical protein
MVSNIDKVKQEMIDQASFRPLVFSATSTNVVDSPLAPFGTKVAPSSMCRSRTGGLVGSWSHRTGSLLRIAVTHLANAHTQMQVQVEVTRRPRSGL